MNDELLCQNVRKDGRNASNWIAPNWNEMNAFDGWRHSKWESETETNREVNMMGRTITFIYLLRRNVGRVYLNARCARVCVVISEIHQ